MASCKDCIHEKLCVIKAFPDAFENTQWGKKPCDHFKPKTEWISVEERLPEPNEECLHVPCCYCEDYNKYIWLSADADTDIYTSDESELAKVRAEVAREIFEEIASKQITIVDHVGTMGVVVLLQDIFELKKKYTEAEAEPPEGE